jgi:hypothetical protein
MWPRKNGLLHDVVVYGDAQDDAWATVSCWVTAPGTVHSQHLVSKGRPEASRAVILSSQVEMANHGMLAGSNWFRAENRFPARVFGTCQNSLDAETSTSRDYTYIAVPRSGDFDLPAEKSILTKRCTDEDCQFVSQLATRLCGPVHSAGEAWQSGDLEMRALDAEFKLVGLRRYRQVFIATAVGSVEPCGFAVAYRGPLGLNFSFLENRCEIWLEQGLESTQRKIAFLALLAAASSTYEDFELSFIPVVGANDLCENLVAEQKANLVQRYTKVTWLRDGFNDWYNHVDGFYGNLEKYRARKNRAGAA